MKTQDIYISADNNNSLWVLFFTYLKIGSTAFGGFMALISVVQSYLVEKRKLISHNDMLDGISLASILPGPIAVNVVVYTGYKMRGVAGAVVCFLGVLLPSFFLILALSFAYFHYGDIPQVKNIFFGFIPAVAAVIIVASINLGKKSLTSPDHYMLSIFSMFTLILLDGFFTTLAIIVVTGLIGYLLFNKNNHASYNKVQYIRLLFSFSQININKIGLYLASIITLAVTAFKFQAIMSIKLLTIFSGMSLMLFGGGFVFIPIMQEIVVNTYSWVTHKEFVDGIALGQVTPGPIVISATFIGYKVAGVLGAATATIGAFVPPALLMIVCTKYFEQMKKSTLLQSVLSGVRCGVIGMIAAASYFIIMSAQQNSISLIIFFASLILLLKFKVDIILIMPVAGLIGYLFL